MSGQGKDLQDLEEKKDAPETVTTVATSGTKRKRTRRPNLIWIFGEKMRADDPRRHVDWMDDDVVTDDRRDDWQAELEFHSIFASIYDVTHTYFGGDFGRGLTSKILPFLVCDCRGRLSCRQMEIHTPPFEETKIFNAMLLNRVRAIPGYVVFSEGVYENFDDYDENHSRTDHDVKPTDISWSYNGCQYPSASDDSAFSDDEYFD
jgi:hypothetical protein